jgi:alpha-tubulin suppressor-like RCC1 family protein
MRPTSFQPSQDDFWQFPRALAGRLRKLGGRSIDSKRRDHRSYHRRSMPKLPSRRILAFVIPLATLACTKPANDTADTGAAQPNTSAEPEPETQPEPKAPLAVVEVAIAGYTSYARMNDGTVRAWGAGDTGQLGDGGARAVAATPVTVAGVAGARSLAAGGGDGFGGACVIDEDARVHCWGSYLLVPGRARGEVATATQIPALAGAKQLSLGWSRGCAVLADDTLSCWGTGHLGEGTHSNDVRPPTAIPNLPDVAKVRVASKHACALDRAGAVHCWGENVQGQADPTESGAGAEVVSPRRVDGLAHAVDIGVGEQFSCALLEDHSVACWGQGFGGGSIVPHEALAGSTGFSTGFGDHICLLQADGKARCIGRNHVGQLGTDPGAGSYANPVEVPGLGAIVSLSTSHSGHHTCAATEDGLAHCWGGNSHGALGDGTLVDHAAPTPVAHVSAATLPEPSTGAAVPEQGPAQSFGDLPEGCVYESKLALKLAGSDRTELEVASAHASVDDRGREVTVDLRNYRFDPSKPAWELDQRPRGDQLWIQLAFGAVEVRYVKPEDEPDAEPERVETPVPVKAEVFMTKGAWLDDRARRESTVEATAHTADARIGLDPWPSKAIGEAYRVELTHVGDEWICGTIDLAEADNVLKGRFTARVIAAPE